MGNKTNINILKYGYVKNWLSLYTEKKDLEKSLYIYKDIELRKFVEKYFDDKNLNVFDIKIFYNETSINFFVAYSLNYSLKKSLKKKKVLDKKKFRSIILKKKTLKTKRIRTRQIKSFLHLRYRFKKYNFFFSNMCRKKNFYNILLYFKILHKWRFNKNNLQMKRFGDLNDLIKDKNINKFLENDFLNHFYKNINNFFHTDKNIKIYFYETNNLIRKIKKNHFKFLKKKLYTLTWYSNENYYREGIIQLFTALFYEKSANFLAKYIANQLKYTNNRHRFLNFVKQILIIFNSSFTSLKRDIIIQVSGRINGRARSKKRVITVGKNVNKISLSAAVDYYQATAFTKDGTLGVKLWISSNQNFKKLARAKHNKKKMKNGPSKIKHKKIRKGRLKIFENKNSLLNFGIFGLKSIESGVIKNKQIEAARQTISRKTKRNSKIWIKIFPSVPITKKSIGVRMGKGKGSFSHWGAKVSCGTTIFEICGKNKKTLLNALIAGGKKLPVKTKVYN